MSVFEQFTAKKSGGAGESPQQLVPQPSQAPPADVPVDVAKDEPEKKSSGWFSRDNLIKGSFLDGFLSILPFGSKSGGYHESEDSPEQGVTALLAALYYVFLIIVLIFVIDQACLYLPRHGAIA
jgi:hypothetical protein